MEKLTTAWKNKAFDKNASCGTYEIWLKEDVAKELLKPIYDALNEYHINKKSYKGESYIGIYTGCSGNLKETMRRLGKTEYTPSIMTCYEFAKVLKGLASKTQRHLMINSIISNCIVDLQTTTNTFEARANKKAALNQTRYYWPLNIKGNHTISNETHTILKRLI